MLHSLDSKVPSKVGLTYIPNPMSRNRYYKIVLLIVLYVILSKPFFLLTKLSQAKKKIMIRYILKLALQRTA